LKGKVLVVGSVTYDIIFAIHGNIKQELHIKDGALERVNMMFTAKDKERYFGGTGGNIAYGLGMLGESPLLFSIVGEDFNFDFKPHLERNNVDLRLITKEGKYTSVFYGISDEDFQQIGIFQPNSYYEGLNESKLADTLSEGDFNNMSYAIFSPGTGISIRNHMLELRNKLGNDVKLIFDPSQVLSILFDKETLRECLSFTDIFIGNETEVKQLKTIFGYEVEDILNLGVEYLIETKGADGSVVYSKSNKVEVESIKPKRVLETTGAGDAFRSGLLFGLINGKNIYESCKIGALTGARCVEEYGGQLYSVNIEELKIKNS
jgi:adenosine kinase